MAESKTVEDKAALITRKTNVKLGLSPGTLSLGKAEKCQKRRLHKQQVQGLPSSKHRRRILKHDRATHQGSLEALDGVSGIEQAADVDIETLPDAVPHRNAKPVKPTIITIDLETTGLIRGTLMPHITQIAAMTVKSGERFSVYTKPQIPISAEAEQITSICVDDYGNMMVNGEQVDSLPINKAIENLCGWIGKYENVYLVAHCGSKFDFPILMTALMKTNNTDMFFKSVSGLVDSWPVFRNKFPGGSLKQVDLVERHLPHYTYNAHHAEADVEALVRLLALCDMNDLLNHSVSPVDVKQSLL